MTVESEISPFHVYFWLVVQKSNTYLPYSCIRSCRHPHIYYIVPTRHVLQLTAIFPRPKTVIVDGHRIVRMICVVSASLGAHFGILAVPIPSTRKAFILGQFAFLPAKDLDTFLGQLSTTVSSFAF